MSEFDLIATYFTWDDFDKQSHQANTTIQKTSNVIKSVGDDAAVLSLAPNLHLVTSIDTLVSGVHFPVNTNAYDIGYKCLAVNLSDLAAMGAKPEWFTLALTLPDINHDWLSEFSRGLKTLAEETGISLVGGDTTSGPLAISIQVMGSVEAGKALFRNGAQLGDKIYVTGTLGDGAAGLASLQDRLDLSDLHASHCQKRLNRPTARLNEVDLIKNFATACIDVSDGLLQDLSHILNQSNLVSSEMALDSSLDTREDTESELGAKLDLSQIPFSNALKSINNQQALSFALTGGDDYELLFTVPEAIHADFLKAMNSNDFVVTCIGAITNEKDIIDYYNNPLNEKGFIHFS